MLLCTLITFALCADPRVPAAISFEQLTVPIVWTPVRLHACTQMGETSAPADAEIETGLAIAGGASDDGRLTGRVTLKLASAKIEMSAFSWPRMSASEGKQVRAVYRATLWHELGHLMTAQASIEAENARLENGVSGASRADFLTLVHERADDAFARVNADQNGYDDLTGHGIRQDAAPPPLAGADTIAQCDPR